MLGDRQTTAALLSTLALLWSCTSEDGQVRVRQGRYSVQVLQNGQAIELTAEDQVLLRFPLDAFQIGLVNKLEEDQSYDPFWLVHEDALFTPEPPPSLRWRQVQSTLVEEQGGVITIQQSFEGSLAATLTITPEAEGRFSVHWVPSSEVPIAYLRLRPRAEDEAFYGLGEYLDDVNHRGKLRPMQIEPDLSIESANNESHVPVPLLIGSRGFGLFVQSERLGVFDVARAEDDLIEITYGTAEQSELGLRFHLFAAEHPLDITRHYYDVTSDPLLPAEWAYGPLIWRDENRDQAEVEDDIRLIRELDLATSGIWIDRPYATAVNSFDFKAEDYPSPESMIQTAHAAGLRVALWHTPYLEETTGALLEEAQQKGYFPPEIGLRLNGWGDTIDFTNPEAYAFWQGLIRRYTDLGIEGFKLDYGEDIVPGIGGGRSPWRFFDGRTELVMHYGYQHLYHQVYAETLPPEGSFLLCRAGRWGDQKNVSVIWPGDLDADLSKHRERITEEDGSSYIAVGGLPASLIMGLTLGPSGFPFYGADTGGYRHSPPNNETFIRWFQQTALSTVMQVGDSSSQPPWEFNEANGRTQETLDLYRVYARLHMRLFPYVWSYARNLAKDGRAIQRSLGLAHPELGVHPSDTYLMGDELLVAPVVEAGVRSRSVHFPEGRWVDWWSLEVLEGGQAVEVQAPLDKLPLYLREGGIVPMLRPTIDTLSPATLEGVESYADEPGRLYARVFAGAESEFVLFDGGKIEQRDGEALFFQPGDKFKQGVTIEVLGVLEPSEVSNQGRALGEVQTVEALEAASEGWVFEAGRLWVKFEEGQVAIR